MPRRGYRKGVSDDKQASPRRLHTRLPTIIHEELISDAASRSIPASRIIRALVTAHYTGKRLELPQPRGPLSEIIRQLSRIGNNLNQLTQQAHLMRLPLLENDVRNALSELLEVLRRLLHL